MVQDNPQLKVERNPSNRFRDNLATGQKTDDGQGPRYLLYVPHINLCLTLSRSGRALKCVLRYYTKAVLLLVYIWVK